MLLYESAALVERVADSPRVETCEKEDHQQLKGNLAAMGGGAFLIGIWGVFFCLFLGLLVRPRKIRDLLNKR